MSALQKLWNDYGIGSIIMAVVVLYVLSLLYNYFTSKSYVMPEKMSPNKNSAYNGSSGAVMPAAPDGQNEVYSSVSGIQTPNAGVPTACSNQTVQNPAELLPKDTNSQWAQLNPAGKGDLANINLLKAGYHIGIDTIGQSMRNANLQIRSEPPNPQINVGPWANTTISPDYMRPVLEIGQGSQ
jgi:hypothetical protein